VFLQLEEDNLMVEELRGPSGLLLTQIPHLAPSTQQAEQAGLTHEQIPKRASQFS
jgi:hypothetical protein